jgi:hypothetical protein
MKNLIYQTYVSKTGETPPHAKISKELFIRYAAKHGAEYQFNDKLTLNTSLVFGGHYERYRLFLDESFDVYDNILYVDSDIVPHNMEANIFDIDYCGLAAMPDRKEELGNWTPGHYILDSEEADSIRKYWKWFGLNVDHFDDGQIRWYNTGVLLINRQMRQRMREEFIGFDDIPEKGIPVYHVNYDEAWFGVNLTKTGMPITNLHPTWNWTGDIKQDIIYEDAKFLHYSGGDHKEIMVKKFDKYL